MHALRAAGAPSSAVTSDERAPSSAQSVGSRPTRILRAHVQCERAHEFREHVHAAARTRKTRANNTPIGRGETQPSGTPPPHSPKPGVVEEPWDAAVQAADRARAELDYSTSAAGSDSAGTGNPPNAPPQPSARTRRESSRDHPVAPGCACPQVIRAS